MHWEGKSDFSDSDKVFAENIGVKCYSPEDIFVNKTETFWTTKYTFITEPRNNYYDGLSWVREKALSLKIFVKMRITSILQAIFIKHLVK